MDSAAAGCVILTCDARWLVHRAFAPHAGDDEPATHYHRVAGLEVSVDRSDLAYHGLDGEDCEQLHHVAVECGDERVNAAWQHNPVLESIVYDALSGEVFPWTWCVRGARRRCVRCNPSRSTEK